MKIPYALVLALSFVFPVFAGESGLIRTFQPLDATGAGWISIEQVTCHVSNFEARQVYASEYISASNIPPTFSDKASGDLNLASTSHIYFDCADSEGKELKLFMNAEQFVNHRSFPREEILKASIECLRRVLPTKLLKTELTFSASPGNRAWMEEIVSEFNHCDRSKEFHLTKKE